MTMFSKLTAVAVALSLATARKSKECTDGSEPTFCMTPGETPICDQPAGSGAGGLLAVLTDDKKEQWECQLNGEEVKDAEPECADGSTPKYCEDGTEPVKVGGGKKGGKKADCAEGETPTYCPDGSAPACEQVVGGDVLTAEQDEKKQDKWRCEDSQGDKVKGTYPTCSDGSKPEASCKIPKGQKDELTAPELRRASDSIPIQRHPTDCTVYFIYNIPYHCAAGTAFSMKHLACVVADEADCNKGK